MKDRFLLIRFSLIKLWVSVVYVLILGSSCIFAQPNLRYFIKGNLSATGALSRGETHFYSFTIGTPDAPFNNTIPFTIRLKNGLTIRSSDFSRDKIERIAQPKNTPSFKKTWGEGAVDYFVEGMTFIFVTDRCVHFESAWISLDKITIRYLCSRNWNCRYEAFL